MTQITMTQMTGRQVEVVTQVEQGTPDVRVLSDAKAAELAAIVAAFLVRNGS
jgi:hypothetical protein